MGMQQIPFTSTRRNPPRLITIDRDRLESLIANAIELLDLIDGDADAEANDWDTEDDDPDWEHDGREEEHG
jgi:hypothetical protein